MRENSLLELEKDFMELKDRELKDRKEKKKKEIWNEKRIKDKIIIRTLFEQEED